jgi:chemotaxis protein CheX
VTDVDDEILEIATSIWETLFTMPLERGDGAAILDRSVTGCVHIDGAWQGAVLLECGEPLAGTLAGQLFQSSSPTPEEVRDTVGELTNMLAGNIKALLPEPSRISLPAVALGGEHALTVMGTRPVSTIPLRCDDAPLVVTLLQSTREEGAEA